MFFHIGYKIAFCSCPYRFRFPFVHQGKIFHRKLGVYAEKSGVSFQNRVHLDPGPERILQMKRVFRKCLPNHVLQNLLTDVAAELRRLEKFLQTPDPAPYLRHFSYILVECSDYPRRLIHPFIKLPGIGLKCARHFRGLSVNRILHAFEPFDQCGVALLVTHFR